MHKFAFVILVLISLISLASAQNVILNSSFEFWLDSLGVRMPFAWFTSEATDSGSAVRVIDPHSGIYALQLNGTDTLAYALTASIGFAGHNYVFSGWCKSSSIIAGSFVITWLNLSQQLIGDPVIIPIYRSTAWRQYRQIVQCPDSAYIANINIVALPTISLTVDDVTLTDTVLTGLEENKSEHKIPPVKIYPNPSSDILWIETSVQPYGIEMYDVSGKKIDINLLNEQHRFRMNTAQLAKGVYFIKIRIAEQTDIQKLIIK